MSKQTGLGAGFFIGGYDLSGDTGSVNRIASPRGVLEVTGINKEAFERLLSHKDGAIDWNSWFNPASNQAHPVLRTLPTADTGVMYTHRTTIGAPVASMVAKQLNYDGNRPPDGSYSFSVNAVANGYGLEWGVLLTAAARTDTGAANGTGVDFGAASSFGLQAYLQVLAFTGTDATVKIQESSDNGSGDAFADVTGGAFTQITTGRQTQRIQTARNLAVERYLRVATTTSGGFSSLAFVVAVTVNPVEVNF